MKLLFVKDELAWPRVSGHDVHCFNMMRAMARRGHESGLLTVVEAKPEALAGIKLVFQGTLLGATNRGTSVPRESILQRKFRSYWGVPSNYAGIVNDVAREIDADAVIAVGITVLPWLS